MTLIDRMSAHDGWEDITITKPAWPCASRGNQTGKIGSTPVDMFIKNTPL